ncbi:hypothetical protein CC78DRAFT_576160 [Lojkania enalia]|uniref:Ankyrin n=1 Tax=Lojkania enalia TaxID=147567 RepID=A0A9P4KHG7_9PLEO|nr:hypothetical protein CC78DRAFT_576160 [Didymosphaeria enalia]
MPLCSESWSEAEILLDMGACPNCSSGHSKLDRSYPSESYHATHTPLAYTFQKNAVPLIKATLGKRADLNAESALSMGAAALQFGAMNNNHEILYLLLEVGADVNALPSLVDSCIATEGAADNGRLNMVSVFLGLGVDL